jgi:hypothetical protein
VRRKRILFNKKNEIQIGTNILSSECRKSAYVVKVQEQTYTWKSEAISMPSQVVHPL